MENINEKQTAPQVPDEHTHVLESEETFGEIRVADEVVAMIAGLAASEVEGVASMAGNLTRDLIQKLGGKSLSRGVRISMEGNEVSIKLAVNLRYGYNVPSTSEAVQEKVKTAIETMTGLKVKDVSIKIVSVEMQEE